MLGPCSSAESIDERATALRNLIHQARQFVRETQWLSITVAIGERIERYENLAARLRELPWWTISRGEQ
jgi:hypothetical protein